MVKTLDIDFAALPDQALLLMVSKLAEVLKAMPNLVDLRIRCGLVKNSSAERTISQAIGFAFNTPLEIID